MKQIVGVASLLMGLTLGGCGLSFQTESEIPEIQVRTFEGYVVKTIEEGPVGSYSVDLEWQLEREFETVVIERTNLTLNDKRVVGSIAGNSTYFRDRLVPHGSNLQYRILGVTNSEETLLTTLFIATPKDLIFADGIPYRISKSIEGQFGRVYLGKETQLVTEGYAINISANNLLLGERSKIVSFDPEYPSRSGKGRDSGVVKIRTNHAHGNLHLVALGQEGAEGNRGADAHGRGSRGSDAYSKCTGHVDSRHCEDFTATDGGKGPTGASGGSGHAGGNISSIHIRVFDLQSQLKVTFSQRAGMGGQGGLGGNGGQGGEGGRGGGREGPRGDQGPSGPRGSNGTEREPCFQIANSEIGKCEALNRGEK